MRTYSQCGDVHEDEYEVLDKILDEATTKVERNERHSMTLFNKGVFRLNSGTISDFKIDCDALTDDEIEVIAYKLSQRLIPFRQVIGVPSGGLRLAKALEQYRQSCGGGHLIVDDVLTTGNTISLFREAYMKEHKVYCFGTVIFARSQPPSWIKPLFLML